MITRTYKTPNHLSLVHRRLESIQEGCAWWRKIPVFCSSLPRKIKSIGFEIGHLSIVMSRVTGVLARLAGRANLQIPIAHLLFGRTAM